MILNVSNEPADVSKINFVDKNVILTTFNGVKAFQKAVKSSKNVFSCSMSNIDTISEFIKNRYKNLHILKAGENSNTNIEDEEISSWIEALVNNNSIDLKYKKINLEKRLLAYPPYHFLEKERQDYFSYLF